MVARHRSEPKCVSGPIARFPNRVAFAHANRRRYRRVPTFSLRLSFRGERPKQPVLRATFGHSLVFDAGVGRRGGTAVSRWGSGVGVLRQRRLMAGNWTKQPQIGPPTVGSPGRQSSLSLFASADDAFVARVCGRAAAGSNPRYIARVM